MSIFDDEQRSHRAKDGFCKKLNDNNHIRQVSQAGLYLNEKTSQLKLEASIKKNITF
jgi:hypothetical protein